MKRLFCYSILFLTAVSITACGKKEELKYVGSSTLGHNIIPEAAKIFTEKTGIKFGSIESPGSGKGIKALIDGKIKLAGASRSLKEKEKEHDLYAAVIGYDAIAVIVNKNNPVTSLTKKQLKDIFTGKVKNWKDIGGKDVPIKPNTEILGEKRATVAVFQKIILDKQAYGKGFLQIDLPRDQVPEVAKDDGGVATVSTAFANKNIKVISVNGVAPKKENVQNGSYIISRPLILITRGFPTGDEKRFIEFMKTSDAQKIVSKKFVPIR